MSKMMSDEWGTPESVWNLVAKTLPAGETMLDPCPGIKQPVFKSVAGGLLRVIRSNVMPTDGLNSQWGAINFVNPPFKNINPWIGIAAQKLAFLDIQSIVLIPDHLDRKWFIKDVQPLIFNDVCRMVSIGRHRFIPLEGQKESSPHFGSCLLFFGDYFNVQNLVDYLRES